MNALDTLLLGYRHTPEVDDRPFGQPAWLVVAAIAAIAANYTETIGTLIALWESSQTYIHGYFIAPASAWLIWNRRKYLATLRPAPNFLGLLLLSVLGFAWLLGTLANVQVVRQYSMVAMIPVATWTILGNQVSAAIAFPLAFLLFSVPFGDAFIPFLMDFTADTTVFALQLTGIPVFREGNSFTLPTGSWSVVEACSGLRYLIASLTLGSLFAYITFYGFRRRLAFILLSAIVPIIANAIRAYLIVMLGHLSDMRLATGIDHLVYGWAFFGIVMFLLFWVGSFWRETENQPAALPAPAASEKTSRVPHARVAAAAATSVVIALTWPTYAAYLDSKPPLPPIGALEVPAGPSAWDKSDSQLSDWAPAYVGNPVRFIQTYRKDGRAASLQIAYYADQRPGTGLIAYGNTLVPNDVSRWNKLWEGARRVATNNQQITVKESHLRSQFSSLLVWRWYWINGEATSNPYIAKMILAWNTLLGRGPGGAEIIVTMPFQDRPAEVAAAMQEFVEAMAPSINKGLEDAQRR